MDPNALKDALPQLIPLITTFTLRVIGVLLFLIAAWIVAGWLERRVTRLGDSSKLDAALVTFGARAARWALLVLAALAALGMFGVETTSFAAVIGAAGLAIGLAFQGSLSNLAAGVMLLIFRPFDVGHTIVTSGERGKVAAIELFMTTLDTPDNRRIIIPNSKVFGSTVENVSFHPVRRCDVAVGVDYDADIDRTREVLIGAIETIDRRLPDRDHAAVLGDLADSSVNWSVRVWVDAAEFWSVKEELTRAVKAALEEAGIGIPYPTMDVNLAPEEKSA